MDLNQPTKFDWYSLSSVPIEMKFNEQLLSTGTAFFFEEEDQLFLITAWHCLSGRNFEDKKHISPTLAEPNFITVWWNLTKPPIGRKAAWTIPIRDESGEPLWLVDAEKGSDVDIAVLPIECPIDATAYPINKLPSEWDGIAVGQDVYILGFPLGIDESKLPIWKRGSLASEWLIDRSIRPYWLIDTASRPGMSGAPIIKRSYPWDRDRHVFGYHGNNGRSFFFGMYTGRLFNPIGTEVHLGIAWPPYYIESIVKHGARDTGF
ncbi:MULTISPECIES: S1 family peptidase [unclassified Sphingomonas]|jgi:hypothetical protein|uniref:S1 family peptidase n=1 Tax=unclassified Sphingomonas TaxID=196159 RepID=UPI0009E8F7D7|nr:MULTISPECIES: serine protease [unclassified Sphingomonas]